MRREVDLSRWNSEAKVLLVFLFLWFPHMGLWGVSKVFMVTWAVHWAVAGVWGYSYLWRAGNQAHRLWLFRRTWGRNDGRRDR